MLSESKKIYMDNGATTPVFPEAIEAMADCMRNAFGNPSSIHYFGRLAYEKMDTARAQVAALIGAPKEDILFTSGGTEADNMVLLGIAERHPGGHIITSSIEHPAVFDTCKHLAKQGYDITYLPVDEYGMVDPDSVKAALRPDTCLVSVMHANNEVGTIQPIKEIGHIVNEAGIPFHVDAVQSVGKIEVDVNELGCDLLTCSSHKINGPKGAGALYIRRGTKINRHVYGGGQERKMRSGTENVPGIVGFGVAAQITAQNWREKAEYNRKLAKYLTEGILSQIDDSFLNGHPVNRLPHNVNVSFSYIEGEALLLYLDMKGIAVSSGSACSSGSLSPSHVLTAMGLPKERLHSAIRMTLGMGNTMEDMDYVINVFKEKVAVLRAASPFFVKK